MTLSASTIQVAAQQIPKLYGSPYQWQPLHDIEKISERAIDSSTIKEYNALSEEEQFDRCLARTRGDYVLSDYKVGTMYKCKNSYPRIKTYAKVTDSSIFRFPFYAKMDGQVKKDDVLLFLGVVRYDVKTRLPDEERRTFSAYTYKFLLDEQPIYCVFKFTPDNIANQDHINGIMLDPAMEEIRADYTL